jgi:hypothetical protein
MTPQDVVGFVPPRGTLAFFAMILTAMAGCFWTPEAEVKTAPVRRD